MKRKFMRLIIVIIFLLGVGCTPKKNVVDNQINNEIKDNVSKEENEFQSKIILFEGQTIYVDNYLSISFKESFFMDRVEPENPIGYYENSIVPKDKNNRFLVLKTVNKTFKRRKINW